MEIQNKFIGMIGLGYWGKTILRNPHLKIDPMTQ